MRIFVLLGQGGRLTSPGMVSLAGRLEKLGTVSIHSWNDPEVVLKINRLVGGIVVIGYSLGANQLGFINSYVLEKRLALGVAYDPSWLSPLVSKENGRYVQRAPRFTRLLCYHNTGAWLWGGSSYVGSNVQTWNVNNFHLGVQFNEELHKRTIAAIEEIA